MRKDRERFERDFHIQGFESSHICVSQRSQVRLRAVVLKRPSNGCGVWADIVGVFRSAEQTVEKRSRCGEARADDTHGLLNYCPNSHGSSGVANVHRVDLVEGYHACNRGDACTDG